MNQETGDGNGTSYYTIRTTRDLDPLIKTQLSNGSLTSEETPRPILPEPPRQDPPGTGQTKVPLDETPNIETKLWALGVKRRYFAFLAFLFP